MAVIEILREATIPISLLPGSHDHLGPTSVYNHALWREASNVVAIREAGIHRVTGGVPVDSPSFWRWEINDPTEALVAMESSDGEGGPRRSSCLTKGVDC